MAMRSNALAHAVQTIPMVDRDSKLTIRISEAELDMLRALAERDGVSASDVLRLFIRRAYLDAFGETTSKAPKKPPKK